MALGGRRLKKKVGRPATGTNRENYQAWADREKKCRECGETKKIKDFPYGHGTYQKSEVCRKCSKPKQEKGEFVGMAYLPRGGSRLPRDHAIFNRPAKAGASESSLDRLSQYILNNEGEIIDFEE